MGDFKPKTTASANALIGIWAIMLTSFIVAALYLGRDIFIPVALAALLTFLLGPLVTRAQRWCGRIGAVLLVVFLILSGAAAAGWMVTSQLVDLAAKLPDYQKNIQTKLRAFKLPTGGRFTRFSAAIEELKKELPGANQPATPPAQPKDPIGDPEAPAAQPAAPIQVPDSSNKTNPFQLLRVIVAPLIGPLGTSLLVLILVIFMLFKKEDLRNRLIRLIGQGHISATTRAMDDAGTRVARYLLMQFILNLSYGVLVAVGLFFIGVPNAILWGASATVLRFIPYVGPWIGAALPIGLALVVSPGWTMPLMALGLFLALELLSNNVMEPWLYGSSTGVTPIALIFAALFWTWLWGPVGLVLATPLTVCLVVMGRHIPRLSFLGVLLSDEEALTPAEDCYYRLLTPGDHDELAFVEAYLKSHIVTELYDSVLIPVVSRMESDYRLELLNDQQRGAAEQSLRDMIEDTGANITRACALARKEETVEPAPAAAAPLSVHCIPARADRDELAGKMLAQLLEQKGVATETSPTNLPIDVLISRIQQSAVDYVCISVVAPSTVLHARYLCLKLRAQLPQQKILVGLWGSMGDLAEAVRRVQESGADSVVTTMGEAVEFLLAAPRAPGKSLNKPSAIIRKEVVECVAYTPA